MEKVVSKLFVFTFNNLSAFVNINYIGQFPKYADVIRAGKYNFFYFFKLISYFFLFIFTARNYWSIPDTIILSLFDQKNVLIKEDVFQMYCHNFDISSFIIKAAEFVPLELVEVEVEPKQQPEEKNCDLLILKVR